MSERWLHIAIALSVAALALGGANARAQEDPELGEPPPPPSAPEPPPKKLAPLRGKLPEKDGMVRVPGGTFILGSADSKSLPNERPSLVVTVAPFWIDRTEVTVGSYRGCVARHLCLRPKRGAQCTFDGNDPSLPVSCVSFRDAETFCRSMDRRLPTETEWEFAAHGTYVMRYPWGGSTTGCSFAVTLRGDHTAYGCSAAGPAQVGSHPAGASPFGIHDMSGNVEEWVADWYVETRTSGRPPRAGASHVLRGGGWMSTPQMSRTTSRIGGSALEAGPNVGFRCARNG